MSKARMTVPGVFLVTRKTVQGQFLLHPYTNGRLTPDGKRLRNFCGYVLAHYANVHRIEVGAFNYYSNHVQSVLYDPHANLPDLQRDHNALLARYVRYLRRNSGAVWDATDTFNKVELTSNGAILNKLAYVIMQQVKDGNLHQPHHWDGLATRHNAVLKPETFYKDEGFWRAEADGGQMPDSVTLTPKPMPGLADELGDAYEEIVRQRCVAYGTGIKRADGRPILGRKVVRRISWDYIPRRKKRRRRRRAQASFEGMPPVDSPEHIKPRFTYRTRDEFIQLVGKHRHFERCYRQRLLAYRAGDRTTPWPYGTFAMCRRLNARQAPPS